jgi:polyphosphate kinase 2
MPRIKKFNRRGLMGDKDKKKDQAEGGKNIKENKTVSTLNDTLEKVFRDVALIDPKENVEGVIKEILRQVRAMKTELTAEEMAQLVFENMQPKSRDYMLAGLLTDIFAKYGEMKTRHTKNMDELSPDISKGVFPYLHNYDDALYKEELYALQVELLKMQRYVKDAGLKIAVIFEGRDAAGKGSTISRFTQNINPRGARVVALPKPTEAQAGQWYFQRYVAQLPSPGEVVFFDRSWYNRAVVEPVMGFCRPEQTQLFLNEVPAFERSLVEHGIHLTKFWLDVSRDEQKRRFKQRRVDPVRRWKLSPVDIASLDRWDDYTAAIEEMFRKTESPVAPWTIIRSDDKRRARLNAIRVFLHSIEYAEKDEEQIGPVDGLIVKSVPEYLRGYRMGPAI